MGQREDSDGTSGEKRDRGRRPGGLGEIRTKNEIRVHTRRMLKSEAVKKRYTRREVLVLVDILFIPLSDAGKNMQKFKRHRRLSAIIFRVKLTLLGL